MKSIRQDNRIESLFSISRSSCNPVKSSPRSFSCYPTAHRSPLTAHRSPAFTLLEIILSLGIVTMLVLMVANMFQEVSVSWAIGSQSAERNTAGRSATDFIARELAQAVAGPIEAANPDRAAIRFILNNGNVLRFVALAGDPENGRVLRGAMFQKDGDILEYCRKTSINPYNNNATNDPANWTWQGRAMLITNVVDFQLVAYANVGDLTNNIPANNPPPGGYDSSLYADQLPACVDIYLEVLGNDDAKKAATLSGAEWTAFVNRNARRYTTRVYFNNRQGYQAR